MEIAVKDRKIEYVARIAGVELDQQQIVAAALRLLKVQGVGELTMRRLGDELGVSARAIYYHFPSKDAVLDAVVAAVYDHVEVPTTGRWDQRLRGFLESIRAVFLDYPGAVPYLLSHGMTTPSGLAMVDTAFGWLLAEGFSAEQVAEAAVICAVVITGQAQVESMPEAPGALRSDQATSFASLTNVVHVAPYLRRPVGSNDFTVAIDALIHELKRWRRTPRPAGPRGPRGR